MSRRRALGILRPWIGVALAVPALAASETRPVAKGLEYDVQGADGARISMRLERLATADWALGPLAIRPFARALVEGGRVRVHRPGELRPAPLPAEPARAASGGEAGATPLHRLAEGLAGRELVEFRIRDFQLTVYRGEQRQLTVAAREARLARDRSDLDLREVHADTTTGQQLEAQQLRLRWDPEQLAVRGPYRLCEAERCERGRDAELRFDPRSGRLAPAAERPTSRAQAEDGQEPGER